MEAERERMLGGPWSEEPPDVATAVTTPAAAAANKGAGATAAIGAEDAARSANARLNSLPRDSELVAQLTAERDKHNERHRQISLLVNRCNQWIMEQKRPLQPAPAVDGIKLQPDETLHDALSKVREQIAALGQHLAGVKSAPLPLEDQEQIAEQYVVKLLAASRPTVAVLRDQLRVDFQR